MIARLSITGGWMWSAWQTDRALAFNSYLFERGDGLVAIDPLAVDEQTIEWMASRGGVHTIVLTNRDHIRESARLRERFSSQIVEDPSDGQEIFPGAFALNVLHGKSPEFAIHLRTERAAVVGDALIGSPAGALSVLADEKLENPEQFLLGLRRLWSLELEALLLCDGQPIWRGADEVLGSFLETRVGSDVNRINIGDLALEYDEQGRFASEDGEVGLLIGARKLGYRISKVPPGSAFCPLHSHEAEEEFYFVLEGEPTVRTLRGNIRCKQGDFIAFPTGARGTHELRNDSSQSCTVLLVGMAAAREICFYPDSDKVMIDAPAREVILRASPALDYYDGE